MAKGKWKFLHRSEQYIYYYRRAIPELFRIYFNSRWEIKKSLQTRDKQVAVIRHNDLNVQVEELFFQISRGLVMPDATSELSSILNFKKDTTASYSEGVLDGGHYLVPCHCKCRIRLSKNLDIC